MSDFAMLTRIVAGFGCVQEQIDAQKSEASEVDLAKAVSDFQSVQTGYDAALKAYSMVQRMSLFDYLR